MNDVKILPRGCKQTVSIHPGESCFDIQDKSKIENPFSMTLPQVSAKNKKSSSKKPKKKVSTRKQKQPLFDEVDDDDGDLDLLINHSKKKTPEQMRQEEDKNFHKEQPKQMNLFADTKGKNKSKKYESEDDYDDDDSMLSDSDSDFSSDGDDDEFTDDSSAMQPVTTGRVIEPEMTRKEIIRRKAQVLARLERRVKFTGKEIEYDPNGTLEHLEIVDAKYNYKANSEVSVQVMRRMLLFSVVGMEAMSKHLRFLALDLDGWSQAVTLTINEYDEILFEIYDYYSGDFDVNPLLKLGVAIFTSALMHSFQKQIFAGAKFSAHIQKNSMSQKKNNEQQQQQQNENNVHVPSQQGFQSHSTKQSVSFANTVEPVDDDEVGEMDGPEDFGEIDEQKLLEEYRRQHNQQLTTTATTIKSPESKNETKEVTISNLKQPVKNKRNTGKTRASSAKTIVAL